MPTWRQFSPTTFSRAAPSPRFHPHSLLSHHGSVHVEVPRKVRCCHLQCDLGFYAGRAARRSHRNAASSLIPTLRFGYS